MSRTPAESCGLEGILDVLYDYDEIARAFTRADLEASRENSHWRYLPLSRVLVPVAAGPARPDGRRSTTGRGLLGLPNLFVKDDSRNPTASLKDRATSVAIASAAEEGVIRRRRGVHGQRGHARSRGSRRPSSCRATSSCPQTPRRPKIAQLLVYGATVFAVDGSYDDAFDLATQAIEHFGWYNRCCAVNPYLVEGKKTVAFEICEQLGFKAPDKVFIPVGDGCITSGVTRDSRSSRAWGSSTAFPNSSAFRPRVRSRQGRLRRQLRPRALRRVHDARTASRSGHPRNWRKATQGIRASGGSMMTVTDDEILAAIATLAPRDRHLRRAGGRDGVRGAEKAVSEGTVGSDETVVVLMTGSGLKDTDSAMRSAGEPVPVGRSLSDVEAASERTGPRQNEVPQRGAGVWSGRACWSL